MLKIKDEEDIVLQSWQFIYMKVKTEIFTKEVSAIMFYLLSIGYVPRALHEFLLSSQQP